MKKAKQGFTLLEVLVALAIFATAAIATIRSVSQHINTLNFLEEKNFCGYGGRQPNGEGNFIWQ